MCQSTVNGHIFFAQTIPWSRKKHRGSTSSTHPICGSGISWQLCLLLCTQFWRLFGCCLEKRLWKKCRIAKWRQLWNTGWDNFIETKLRRMRKSKLPMTWWKAALLGVSYAFEDLTHELDSSKIMSVISSCFFRQFEISSIKNDKKMDKKFKKAVSTQVCCRRVPPACCPFAIPELRIANGNLHIQKHGYLLNESIS